MMLVLATLAVLGQSAFFAVDTLLHKRDASGTNHVLTETGCSCTMYIRHGENSPVFTITGGVELTVPDSVIESGATRYWSTYTFPDHHTVSVNANTMLYHTTCLYGLLVDTFYLSAPDGTNQWGGNGQLAYCLSRNKSGDKEYYNNKADMMVSGWTPIDQCYNIMMFNPDGNVQGAWTGYLGNRWYDFEDISEGRRALQETLPSDEDIVACEQDETTTEADCIALVDQIFDYAIAHQDSLEVVQQVDATYEVLEQELEEEEQTSERRRKL